MKLAVVILNYNGIELLKEFIPKIVKYSTNSKLYLIDNCSSDKSINYVEKNFSHITIIKHAKNLGYAKAYNEGIKKIKEEILCLINSDVLVTKNWTAPILNLFKKNDFISVIQPKIKDYYKKNYFEYAGAAGGFLDINGIPFCNGRLGFGCEKDLGQYNGNYEITWASGACFFIRNKLFKDLNGFDESFFMHFEEIDICLRLKRNGYKIWYSGDAEVFHLGGSTLNYDNPKKLFFNIRNSLICYTKNLPILILLFVFFSRLFIDFGLIIFFFFKLETQKVKAIINAYFSFMRNFNINFKKRDGTVNPLKLFSVILNMNLFKNLHKKY